MVALGLPMHILGWSAQDTQRLTRYCTLTQSVVARMRSHGSRTYLREKVNECDLSAGTGVVRVCLDFAEVCAR